MIFDFSINKNKSQNLSKKNIARAYFGSYANLLDFDCNKRNILPDGRIRKEEKTELEKVKHTKTI
jgi:hypothetical protein